MIWMSGLAQSLLLSPTADHIPPRPSQIGCIASELWTRVNEDQGVILNGRVGPGSVAPSSEMENCAIFAGSNYGIVGLDPTTTERTQMIKDTVQLHLYFPSSRKNSESKKKKELKNTCQSLRALMNE